MRHITRFRSKQQELLSQVPKNEISPWDLDQARKTFNSSLHAEPLPSPPTLRRNTTHKTVKKLINLTLPVEKQPKPLHESLPVTFRKPSVKSIVFSRLFALSQNPYKSERASTVRRPIHNKTIRRVCFEFNVNNENNPPPLSEGLAGMPKPKRLPPRTQKPFKDMLRSFEQLHMTMGSLGTSQGRYLAARNKAVDNNQARPNSSSKKSKSITMKFGEPEIMRNWFIKAQDKPLHREEMFWLDYTKSTQ